tara:strand:+ start:203 stop:487 length:285 start_codon:yes stop_codon:yes gene_type:complete
MKITETQLKQIIAEETQTALTREAGSGDAVSKVSISKIDNLIAEVRGALDKVEAYMGKSGNNPVQMKIISDQLHLGAVALYKASYETDHPWREK